MVFTFEKGSGLLIIDIQEDNTKVFNFQTFKKNIIKLIKKAQENQIPIFYIFLSENRHSYWIDFKKELPCGYYEEGHPIDFIIPFLNKKQVILKPTYDSFRYTDLEKILKKKKIKNLYISGVLTGVCVLNTVFSAFNLGFRVFVIENCCSDKNKKRHTDFFSNYTNYLFIKKTV